MAQLCLLNSTWWSYFACLIKRIIFTPRLLKNCPIKLRRLSQHLLYYSRMHFKTLSFQCWCCGGCTVSHQWSSFKMCGLTAAMCGWLLVVWCICTLKQPDKWLLISPLLLRLKWTFVFLGHYCCSSCCLSSGSASNGHFSSTLEINSRSLIFVLIFPKNAREQNINLLVSQLSNYFQVSENEGLYKITNS